MSTVNALCVGGMGDGKWFRADTVRGSHTVTETPPLPDFRARAPVEKQTIRQQHYRLEAIQLMRRRVFLLVPFDKTVDDAFDRLLHFYSPEK